jgi:hypothetical protein
MTNGSLAQTIAQIAWTCIKECRDHQPQPVLCVKHQLEAEALLAGQEGPPAPPVRALVEQWRTLRSAYVSSVETHIDAARLEMCADELEAALKAAPPVRQQEDDDLKNAGQDWGDDHDSASPVLTDDWYPGGVKYEGKG